MDGKRGRIREGRGPCPLFSSGGPLLGKALLTLLPFLPSACGPSSPPPAPLPPGVDALEVAEAASARTHPGSPRQIRFQFRVREADFRFQGRGVARLDPTYRVRLDLFSNQGETLFQAALVGSELRIPAWAPKELAPPPALLWAALGIFRPDADLALLGGQGAGGEDTVLRYGDPEKVELRFRIRDGQLTRAELYRGGRLSEEVDLTLGEGPEGVVETVYRNRGEFLEMTFSLDSMEEVESFPARIWYPGR